MSICVANGHLWYLSPKIVPLKFFDDNVPVEKKMVIALSIDWGKEFTERYIIKPNQIISLLNKGYIQIRHNYLIVLK